MDCFVAAPLAMTGKARISYVKYFNVNFTSALTRFV